MTRTVMDGRDNGCKAPAAGGRARESVLFVSAAVHGNGAADAPPGDRKGGKENGYASS